MFRIFWATCLSIGNKLGAIGSLIGFPGVVVAVYVFHAELIDLFTRPDVSAKLREVTLRCAYKFERGPLYDRYRDNAEGAFGAICRNSPFGVSFSYNLTNQDSINRQLKGLRILTEIPRFGTQDLGFAYDVEHVVRDGYDSAIRRPWFVRRLTPGVTTTHEALMLVEPAEEGASEITFGTFLAALREDPSVFSDTPLALELFGQVDSAPEIKLGECTWSIPAQKIRSFLAKGPDGQFQLTGYCNSKNPT